MSQNLQNKVMGYHYTNQTAYKSMKTGRDYGKTGLIPIRRFIKNDIGDFPSEAYKGTIQGLLEPEPKSWKENQEFPDLWKYLMNDICRENGVIMLLSFEILPDDKAYVVERAHVERELYKPRENITKKFLEGAWQKYWESRVPVFHYRGDYILPQLTIWSSIEFERLKIKWIKSSDEAWNMFFPQSSLV